MKQILLSSQRETFFLFLFFLLKHAALYMKSFYTQVKLKH